MRAIEVLRGCAKYYIQSGSHRVNRSAFNGQLIRKEIFRELVEKINPKVLVETGTHFGDTTEYMANSAKLPVYSVESDPKAFGYSKARLFRNKNVKLTLGDSRTFLNKLAHELPDYSDILFYLDAHWGPDLPLAEELENIFSAWASSVVMIDDFAVPDDNGYSYDDYGDDKILNLRYVAKIVEKHQLKIYFPSASSDKETGAKKGCVVLAKDGFHVEKLGKLSHLKCYEKK